MGSFKHATESFQAQFSLVANAVFEVLDGYKTLIILDKEDDAYKIGFTLPQAYDYLRGFLRSWEHECCEQFGAPKNQSFVDEIFNRLSNDYHLSRAN